MVILSRLYYWPYFSSGRTSSLRVLIIACFAILLFVPSNSSGFSKDGTLPHLSTAQADVENGDDGLISGYSGNVPRGSPKVPSSFTLRVGDACVLVTVLPRNVLQIASVRPSLSPFGILRTPELFCSLIGRQTDCHAARRMVRDIDEDHIASRGSHISAAGLSLGLADDSQERSLLTGSRPLSYNALIMGRDKNKNNKIKIEMEASHHSLLEGAVSSLQDMSGNGIVSSNVPMSITDTELKSNSTTTLDDAENNQMENTTALHTVELNSNITARNAEEVAVNIGRVDGKQKPERQPLCRLFKVDLTGQFYRIQAGAVGCGADKIEEWMRTRGSYLAAKSRSVKNVPLVLKRDIVGGSGVEGNEVVDSDDVSRSPDIPDMADNISVETDGQIGSEEEGQTDMQTCLSIAHSCLHEVYGPSVLANSTVQLATIEGNELWGPEHLDTHIVSITQSSNTNSTLIPTVGLVIDDASSTNSLREGNATKDTLHSWWMKRRRATTMRVE